TMMNLGNISRGKIAIAHDFLDNRKEMGGFKTLTGILWRGESVEMVVLDCFNVRLCKTPQTAGTSSDRAGSGIDGQTGRWRSGSDGLVRGMGRGFMSNDSMELF